VIALTQPGRGWDVDHRQHLLARQEANHLAVEALHRHRQCPLDDAQVGDVAPGGELQERSQRREPDVAAARRVAPALLQVVQEACDELWLKVGQLNSNGRLAQGLLGKAQQQHEAVTVGCDRLRAERSLARHVVGEEFLHQ